MRVNNRNYSPYFGMLKFKDREQAKKDMIEMIDEKWIKEVDTIGEELKDCKNVPVQIQEGLLPRLVSEKGAYIERLQNCSIMNIRDKRPGADPNAYFKVQKINRGNVNPKTGFVEYSVNNGRLDLIGPYALKDVAYVSKVLDAMAVADMERKAEEEQKNNNLERSIKELLDKYA